MTNEERLRGLVDPSATQVFLLGCPANIPANFAIHTWFVVNRRGMLARWEMLFQTINHPYRWGNLYRDFFRPFSGIGILPFTKRFLWPARLLGVVDGMSAPRAAETIECSPMAFPYCHQYRLLGPNSNTYTQWVVDRIPEFDVRLPLRAFGRFYRGMRRE